MECITFGESMVLFNPESQGPLKYVHSFTKTIAGAESNVAIALARLGHQSGWFSNLGHDEFGRYIKAIIAGEGVDVSRITFDRAHPTGLLFKERLGHVDPNVYYYRKHSAASHMTPEVLDADYIRSAKILHISGITPALSESARATVFEAIKIAKANNTLVSFDPNIRLKLWSLEEAKPVLLEIAGMSDIIFPGIDEGRMLLNLTDPIDIAEAFHSMGCKTAAVKLGKEGCYVSDSKAGGSIVKGHKIESVVDTVGAGDGFAAGFLSGILQEHSIIECGSLANCIGAMATLVSGDMEGYPTEEQVDRFLGRGNHVDR